MKQEVEHAIRQLIEKVLLEKQVVQRGQMEDLIAEALGLQAPQDDSGISFGPIVYEGQLKCVHCGAIEHSVESMKPCPDQMPHRFVLDDQPTFAESLSMRTVLIPNVPAPVQHPALPIHQHKKRGRPFGSKNKPKAQAKKVNTLPVLTSAYIPATLPEFAEPPSGSVQINNVPNVSFDV